MLGELIEFDEAVGYALAWNAKRGNDTLIIATADHGHGYDVWGTVDTQGEAALPPRLPRHPAHGHPTAGGPA